MISYLERVGKMPALLTDPLADADRTRLLELWQEMGQILQKVR